GESYARERWGHRLASFDAILRRDVFNATVGKSLLAGVVLAPVVASADLVPAALAVLGGIAHPSPGFGTMAIVGTTGGALTFLTLDLIFSLLVGVVAIMFLLALFRRISSKWPGIVLACASGVLIGLNVLPIEPQIAKVVLGIGSVLVGCLVFFAFDLLASIAALSLGWMLVGMLPFMTVASGSALTVPAVALGLPFGVAILIGVPGFLTGREISYHYQDLAPHVRRIIERERVKAEIDAANRIQAALLPDGEPDIPGVSVASHYRAATEIGGDYFDFLSMDEGRVGIAFGDVAGHGLTSGIVMAMAKSALLVQLEHDSTPRTVMERMNDVVIRTGPKRMMMTFFFGLLDPVDRRLRFSSAGHLDPYVYRGGSGRLEELSAWGYPLGIRRRKPFPEMEVEFDPGDRLVLYSDGLIEAINDDGEPFGFKRFEKALLAAARGSSDEIRMNLLDAVRKFTRNRPPEDDQTLVVISFDSLAPMRELEASASEQIAVGVS
ncbi:MAG: PP2C family protein-serine/threonine phosphatase, partial [Thermoanaerobaculia bacterium]|nr:PP2C family protein-serine/threonine phosphatase [Thermoanaerobaculia bacterium]